MAYLATEVSRRKFHPLVDELCAYVAEHKPPWAIAAHGYPFIGLHVQNTSGVPKLGLRLDASEWSHRPLGVQPVTLDFRTILNPAMVPQAEAVEGGYHIYFNRARGEPWFCAEGTMEFHDAYAEQLPWEAVRNNPNMKPGRVVSRCVGFIDRSRL